MQLIEEQLLVVSNVSHSKSVVPGWLFDSADHESILTHRQSSITSG